MDFRMCTFDSALSLASLKPSNVYARSNFHMLRPYLPAKFPSIEAAGRVSECCSLIKYIGVVVGEGKNFEECLDSLSVRRWPKEIGTREETDKHSWKIDVETFGRRWTREERSGMVRRLAEKLRREGPVRMKDPQLEFTLIHEYQVGVEGDPVGSTCGGDGGGGGGGGSEDAQPPPRVPAVCPIRCYVVVKVTRDCLRRNLSKHHLTKRPFLGPTSMDNEVAHMMCTGGMVKKNDVVFDPFVGTGSILFTATTRGAYTVGSDIDMKILRGNSEGENIFANFDKFELPRPEIVRGDSSDWSGGWCGKIEGYFDAIITDPPYGIRAGARRSGLKDYTRPYTIKSREDHIPATHGYEVGDVMADLLSLSARTLKVGGYLVYLIPTLLDFTPSDLPTHPLLSLEWCCYQPLQLTMGRRMIVMRKAGEWESGMAERWRDECWSSESLERLSNLKKRLEALAVEGRKKRMQPAASSAGDGGGGCATAGVGKQQKISRKNRRKLIKRNQIDIKKFED